MRIVELARDPELDLGSLVRLLAQDPALSARLMRASNSCLFARRHKSESLRQAIVVIGLNATMTLALSFSLAGTLRSERSSSRWVEPVWRRVLIASCAARLLGGRLGRSDTEELALAALLQDIGVLALCAALGDEYQPLLEQACDHDELIQLERDQLGTDHGEAGSWLMEHWRLSDKLVAVPIRVHGNIVDGSPNENQGFFSVIEVSGRIADLLLARTPGERTDALLASARNIEGLTKEVLDEILEELSQRLPEIAELYETELISEPMLVGIVDQARQALLERDLMFQREVHADEQERSRQQIDTMFEANDGASSTAKQRSTLLDDRLSREYRRATGLGYPLALAFVRLDDHLVLLERNGVNAVSGALEALRRRLSNLAGRPDLVIENGPDEFAVLLPGIEQDRAHDALDRLRTMTAGEKRTDDEQQPFSVTLTIGMACHMDGSQLYAHASELLRSADQAVRGPVSEEGNSLTLAC